MRLRNMFLLGTGLALLPARIRVQEAIAAGMYSVEDAERSEQISVSAVDPEVHSPELAIEAGAQAPASGGRSPGGVGMLLFGVARDPEMVPFSAALSYNTACASRIAVPVRSGQAAVPVRCWRCARVAYK